MKDYKERHNFILRTAFWKCLVPMPLKNVTQKTCTFQWQKFSHKVIREIVVAYSLARFRIVTHSNAASFFDKNHFM